MATPEEELGALLRRCTDLISELSAFQACAKQNEVRVDISPYKNLVRSEHKTLERTLNSSTRQLDELTSSPSVRISRALRSSNLPYLEAVWAAARSASGIVSLHRRFRWVETLHKPDDGAPSQGSRKGPITPKHDSQSNSTSVLVDVVAREGAEWIKVSTLTEKRLLFELAKAGRWDGDYSDSDSDSEDGVKISALQTRPHLSRPAFSDEDSSDGDNESNVDPGSDSSSSVHIIRLAASLVYAASQTRVRGHSPTVRFVLPRLTEGRNAIIDDVLKDLRDEGVVIDCCQHAHAGTQAEPETDFPKMLPTHQPALTDDLNVDCTILLALISDVSHGSVDSSTAVHPFVAQQIALEAVKPLLPTSLYPVLAGRRLHTSAVAAQRMREIVQLIGTGTEKERADIFLGEGLGKSKSEQELQAHWRQLSEHDAPELKFPIRICAEIQGQGWVIDDGHDRRDEFATNGAAATDGEPRPDASYTSQTGFLQPPSDLADRVLQEANLSAVNRAVWFLGWATGWVTVSSNRTVARTVEDILEKVWRERMDARGSGGGRVDVEDVVGPSIWICGTARSLVGKEMKRGGKAATEES